MAQNPVFLGAQVVVHVHILSLFFQTGSRLSAANL